MLNKRDAPASFDDPAERQHTSVVRTSRPIKRLISGQRRVTSYTRTVPSFSNARLLAEALHLFPSLSLSLSCANRQMNHSLSFFRSTFLSYSLLSSFITRFPRAHALSHTLIPCDVCACTIASFVTRYCGRGISRERKGQGNAGEETRERARVKTADLGAARSCSGDGPVAPTKVCNSFCIQLSPAQ